MTRAEKQRENVCKTLKPRRLFSLLLLRSVNGKHSISEITPIMRVLHFMRHNFFFLFSFALARCCTYFVFALPQYSLHHRTNTWQWILWTILLFRKTDHDSVDFECFPFTMNMNAMDAVPKHLANQKLAVWEKCAQLFTYRCARF